VDPDRALVEDAARGNTEAFDELVRRYQRQVFNLVRALAGADADADDLAQDAFVRAWRGLAAFRFESTFKTWLHGVAVNVVRSDRARRARLRRFWWSPPRGSEPQDDPVERVAVDEKVEENLVSRDAIDRALAALPDDLREAVVLRDIQGLEYKEIAAALGIPIGTVESRIFRGRKQLRGQLKS
jgi:RNA polymerase sigma-70 factor (ECF subfamily)